MYLSNKFFRFLFGVSGTRTAVPDATDPSGYVSYEEGYPADYSLPSSNPSRKPVERDKSNQIYYDLTSGIKQYQEYGIPEWIAAADNGGSAKSYAKNVRVLYTADAGVTWNVYESLVNSNTATPGTDPTKWALYTRNASIPSASAGGTADAITATFSPSFTAYSDVTGVMIRTSSDNTSATPTINIDGLGAKTVVKQNNQAVLAGDLSGWIFVRYDSGWDKIVLMNPAEKITQNLAAKGSRIEADGFITQWGTISSPSSGSSQVNTAETFDVVFPNAVLSLTLSGTVSANDRTGYNTLTTAGFNCNVSDPTGGTVQAATVTYIAIGY